MKQQEARNLALSDQLWATVEEHLPAICKIAETAEIDDEYERDVVKQCMCLVAGEIYTKMAKREATNTE